ncbi:MAG: GAF domain-containing protein [Planctomycetes bacterium]|nr:GAF domain-containing protein [Planctomycetota bacterium]
MSQDHPLLTRIEPLLTAADGPAWARLLAELLAHFDCALGTLHLLDDGDGLLHLTADTGLPPVVRDKVTTVPIGKGMAGIAAERRQPVQVCNLQTDASGVVRPGAKDTKMEGSIAVPILDGDRVRGVLGVAKTVAYDFTDEETALLLAVAARIARFRP